MHGVGLLVQFLRGGQCRHRGVDRGSVEAAVDATRGGRAPHPPGFPARTDRNRSGPARRRWRRVIESASSGASHMRSSMPASAGTMSSSSISAARRTMPSVRLKPDGEVLQVGRRRQHHRVGAAVIGERDRGLFRDRPARRASPRSPRQAVRATLRTGSRQSVTSPARPRCGGSSPSARDTPSAIRSDRSTATPAPRSPCIPGSSSPSRNSRW